MRLKCLLILPLLVVFLKAASVDDLTFALNSDGTEYGVTDCSESASGSLDIPSTYSGLPVTSIGDTAFASCSSLTSVTIPDSVTSIGAYTFISCTSLTNITIPNSVTSIEFGAFRECSSLTSIIIPNSVTSIGRYAFSDCSDLTSITIPSSVTSIGDVAFGGCSSLTSITFEGDAPTFGTNVFLGSDSATIYHYSYNSGWSSMVAGIPAVQILTFTLNGDSTEYSVTDCLTTASGSLDIPSNYNGLPVTTIGDFAFHYCISLTTISIPDSVISIGYRAFYNCTNLTSIIIPDSVTSIGDDAFALCSGLTNITIGDSVTSIGDDAFASCSSLTSITIPDSVTSIEAYTFYGCTSLTSITIPDSVISIGYRAFYNCNNLTSIIIPDSVTSIGDNALGRCSNLASITIPDSVTSIGDWAFSSCSKLTSVRFDGDAPTIGTDVFYNTQTSYILVEEENITSYGGDGSFYGGLAVVDPSKFAAAANLYTQQAYDAVVTERDARLTMDEVRDARVGSTMIEVSEGKADITVTLEETSELTDWTNATTSEKTIEVDAPSGTRFYRFKMSE